MSVNQRSRSSSQLIFYLMFIYILASFSWWAIMFLRNNKEAFNKNVLDLQQEWVAQAEIDRSNGLNTDRSQAAFEGSEMYLELASQLRQKNAMIIGEGLVFILLISIGFWKIRNSFKEEVALTKQQNNFILSITHELKSPLASIKLSLETLFKRALSREQVELISSRSLEDVERLERMVENILMASRLESPAHRFDKNLFDFSAMVREIFDSISYKHPSVQLVSAVEGGLQVEGDAFALSSVVVNLLENAIKYSKGEGEVNLTLSTTNNDLKLSISDQGVGIPEAERELIFKRFYRIGSEETRASKGTGLGLFIVQEIVRAHNGRIKVLGNVPKGSIFEVSLPIAVESVSDLETQESVPLGGKAAVARNDI